MEKMSILFNRCIFLIHKNILTTFLKKFGKSILIHVEIKGPKIVKTLKKKNYLRGLIYIGT